MAGRTSASVWPEQDASCQPLPQDLRAGAAKMGHGEILLDGMKRLDSLQGAFLGATCGQNASGGAKAEIA